MDATNQPDQQPKVELRLPTHCNLCSKDVWPYYEPASTLKTLDNPGELAAPAALLNGSVARCPQCKSAIGIEPAVGDTVKPKQAAPQAAPAAAAPASDFMSQAGARLDEIERELSHVPVLRDEAKRLRRLLGRKKNA